jgi:internalin A
MDLDQLESLDLAGCKNLKTLDVTKGLPGLSGLDISGCDQISDFTALARGQAETHYAYHGKPRESAKPRRDQRSSLVALADDAELPESAKYRRHPEMEDLHYIELSNCPALKNIDAVAGKNALSVIKCNGCSSLESIEGAKDLPDLNTVYLSGCDSIKNFEVLKTLPTLADLNLSHCSALRDLRTFGPLSSIVRLDLSHCQNIESLDGLKEFKSLAELNISGCSNLRSTDAIAGRQMDIDYSNCDKLTPKSLHMLKAIKARQDAIKSNPNAPPRFTLLPTPPAY